jgi:ADP-heptose:LPS heptosyltransferase
LAFDTDLRSIPSRIPYIRSDPPRVAAWRHELGHTAKPRVGLVWSGNAAHRNDRNRSIAFAEMLAVIGDWAQWTSLQRDVRESDAPLLASSGNVRHLGGRLRDFADTAALIELMDVVVTVDTSVAHLAGAMGKPVWILLPHVPDWRWLLDRDDSVWYPTARLFRQPTSGDWTSAIRRLGTELETRLRGRDTRGA